MRRRSPRPARQPCSRGSARCALATPGAPSRLATGASATGTRISSGANPPRSWRREGELCCRPLLRPTWLRGRVQSQGPFCLDSSRCTRVPAAYLPLRGAQHLGCFFGKPSHALFLYVLPHQPKSQLALGCAHMLQHSQHAHCTDVEQESMQLQTTRLHVAGSSCSGINCALTCAARLGQLAHHSVLWCCAAAWRGLRMTVMPRQVPGELAEAPQQVSQTLPGRRC